MNEIRPTKIIVNNFDLRDIEKEGGDSSSSSQDSSGDKEGHKKGSDGESEETGSEQDEWKGFGDEAGSDEEEVLSSGNSSHVNMEEEIIEDDEEVLKYCLYDPDLEIYVDQ